MDGTKYPLRKLSIKKIRRKNMSEDTITIIAVIVALGIWGYAIKRLGLLMGISVGWIPAGIVFYVMFGILAVTLG